MDAAWQNTNIYINSYGPNGLDDTFRTFNFVYILLIASHNTVSLSIIGVFIYMRQ